ncbi:hypothetical protein [Marixanthomonas spongiae]|nr:hypothetical protein [Marixanthomonas spongiae]
MEPNQRFTILTFPQFFDGENLHLNIVVLPRDQNPLAPAIVGTPPIPNSDTAFADAAFEFTAKIQSGFTINPLPLPQAGQGIPLSVSQPENARDIFEALAQHFNIDDVGMDNATNTLENLPADRKPEAPRTQENSVKKYIPKTFFEVSGMQSIDNPNAVTDDSYHCAIKDGKFNPNFQQSTDAVSWGKVFAYLLRQPLLAREAGMIFTTQVPIDENTFPDGGYLYIDTTENSSYFDQKDADPTFIKHYAARIPALVPGEARQVFAAVQFPVLQTHSGNYDRLFIEAADYDDGFTKIIHTFQPRNRDMIVEESDGNYPVKDVGIQFAFDDVQILERYMRQLMIDTSVGPADRLDAPVGVFGYVLDVRQTAEPENEWESLNLVSSNQPLVLFRQPGNTDNPIVIGDFEGELPFQVYPIQIDGRSGLNYWLPMYYGGWNGHNIVLPDPDAAAIYQNTSEGLEADEEIPVLDENGDPTYDDDGNPITTGTGVSEGGADNQLNQLYSPGPLETLLRYGLNYEFRARMMDISGGAPSIETNPIQETASNTTTTRLKRFISPNQPIVAELQPTGNDDDTIANTDTVSEISELNLKRPKLGYPAVVFTGKYQNPIQRLIDQSTLSTTIEDDLSVNAEHRTGLGIADPDVDRVEVIVEIQSLKLDKLDSVSGQEDYVHLYTTYRSFPTINTDDDYDANLNIPIEYVDVSVLHTGDEVDITNDFNLTSAIDDLSQIVLPTGRTVRLTLRAVCEEKENPELYFGVINNGNKQMDNRYGETLQVTTYKIPEEENNLFQEIAGVPSLQGIFMQPDLETSFDGKFTSFLFGKEANVQPDNIQRLAAELNIENNKLTLTAPKGERIVFGCSSRIRHTLSPDHSSLTIASKGDLANHWLCCISLSLERDWMWDALKTRSFVIKRTKKYTRDDEAESTEALIGDIEIMRTAPFDALDTPNRNATRIIFIDAVEPTKEKPDSVSQPDFPDTIALSYTIEAQYKADSHTASQKLEVLLPITTPPAQVPKVASAGYALSPYERDETYSSTVKRQRYLWIEFEEPIADPQDTYFARVLNVAPDQLLSNNAPNLLKAPKEPQLPISPEFIRIITEDSSNDLAGLNAMQPMKKSTTSDRHYLLPIPAGMHANADELFGFFTYEFRIGHYQNPDTNEPVWTTAQGRYGRRLRATGIQHPAPTLLCSTNRDEKKLWVTAPYAVAVHESKNVTANPPRTQLWALLYAQVKQADNLDYRNILLDDKQLDWRIEVTPEKEELELFDSYTSNEIELLNNIAFSQFSTKVSYTEFEQVLKLKSFSKSNKDATKYGTTVWTNGEVNQLLRIMGLPADSALSVVVVEVLPHINTIWQHVSQLQNPEVKREAENLVGIHDRSRFSNFTTAQSTAQASFKTKSPVDEDLGNKRIYRTSNLEPVPEVCCSEC